jgi:hypothetical protein
MRSLRTPRHKRRAYGNCVYSGLPCTFPVFLQKRFRCNSNCSHFIDKILHLFLWRTRIQGNFLLNDLQRFLADKHFTKVRTKALDIQVNLSMSHKRNFLQYWNIIEYKKEVCHFLLSTLLNRSGLRQQTQWPRIAERPCRGTVVRCPPYTRSYKQSYETEDRYKNIYDSSNQVWKHYVGSNPGAVACICFQFYSLKSTLGNITGSKYKL